MRKDDITLAGSSDIAEWLAGIEASLRKLRGQDEIPYGVRTASTLLIKELALYRSHLADLASSPEVAPEVSHKRKIQLGGGVHLLPGFLNIDIAGPADLVCDVREDIPLESSCSEFIFSEHLLEHLDYPRSARKFVAECYRLLQVGGTLVIGVPDARPAVLAYAAQDQTLFEEMKQRYHMREISPYLRTPIEWLNFVFRDESCSDKYSPHLWAYDFESLVRLVSEAGFREAKRWDVDDSLINPKRKPTTVYVQALK